MPTRHFPEADKWMWTYCMFLGQFTHRKKDYDLGVYVSPDTEGVSFAIVYGNEPGSYMSGPIFGGYVGESASFSAVQIETIKRYVQYLRSAASKHPSTECALFTFPDICVSCQQEEDEPESQYSGQMLSIHDIQESGWPLCPICSAELTVYDVCEIKTLEEVK